MHNRTGNPDRTIGVGDSKSQRRYPIGAELIGDGRVDFLIGAPKGKRLVVVLEGELGKSPVTVAAPTFLELEGDAEGYFSGANRAKPGALYRFRLNREGNLYPDPRSRFQPDGPHGPSC